MTRYFLGVDIGGTKTHALIADQDGRALGFAAAGAGSHVAVGYEGMRRVLHDVVSRALRRAGLDRRQLAGAGFGISAYDWPAQDEQVLPALQSLQLPAPLAWVNDTLIGLIAGASRGWGIAIVSGTSVNCRGRDCRGREGKVIAGSCWWGEHAGGIELVNRAQQALAREWTRRGPHTALSDALIAWAGASDLDDLIEGLCMDRYELAADAAPVVFRVANEGDPVAQEIVRWAGRELGSLVLGVTRQLDFAALDFEVVMIGSMFKGSPVIEQEMAAVIHGVAPGARLVRLHVPPVIGGVLLGMEQVGVALSAPRQRLMATVDRVFADSTAGLEQ